jgi:colicin import membrane protein
MARKLKIYQTSQGFFDLAIAVPSMTAALEAWGANSNLFHQGFAKEIDDPTIIAAALAKPGVILKRPVGTNGTFVENASLPTSIANTGRGANPGKPAKNQRKPAARVDDKTTRKAALAYEKEERRRETGRCKEEEALAKRRAIREHIVEKAEAELKRAKRDHEERMAAIDVGRAEIDSRTEAEEHRWNKLREQLNARLRKARG